MPFKVLKPYSKTPRCKNRSNAIRFSMKSVSCSPFECLPQGISGVPLGAQTRAGPDGTILAQFLEPLSRQLGPGSL